MATRKQLIQYAVAGVVVVIVAFATYSYFGGTQAPTEQAAQKKAAPVADDPVMPTAAQADKILLLLGQARQYAADGKFSEADAALDMADKVVKDQPQVAEARRDVAQLKTPEGQLAIQLTRAELAVEHGDKDAAEKALAAVEKLKPDAPEIAELKAKLEKNRSQDTRRDSRLTRHLTTMREAISRGDFAAADSELNTAERIAVDDPEVQKARRELNRARNAAQKKN